MSKSFTTISGYISKLDKFRRDGQVSDADIFKALDRDINSKKDGDWVTGEISDMKVEGYIEVQRDYTVFPSHGKFITFTDKALDVLEGRTNAASNGARAAAPKRKSDSHMSLLAAVVVFEPDSTALI